MKRPVTAAILTALVAGILIGSFLPWRTKLLLGTMRKDRVIAGVHLDLHRVLHMVAFGAMAWLLTRLFSLWRARLLTALLAIGMAVGVEAGEARIFHNPIEWADVRDDGLGVAIALAISALLRVRAGSANPAASAK